MTVSCKLWQDAGQNIWGEEEFKWTHLNYCVCVCVWTVRNRKGMKGMCEKKTIVRLKRWECCLLFVVCVLGESKRKKKKWVKHWVVRVNCRCRYKGLLFGSSSWIAVNCLALATWTHNYYLSQVFHIEFICNLSYFLVVLYICDLWCNGPATCIRTDCQ